MLTRDATWTMPPAAEGYRGHAAIRAFFQHDVSSVRWQHRVTRANGQLAVACYAFDAGRGRYLALVLDVLTLEADQIVAVTSFIAAEGFTEQTPGGVSSERTSRGSASRSSSRGNEPAAPRRLGSGDADV
jgi:hypothetical protein